MPVVSTRGWNNKFRGAKMTGADAREFVERRATIEDAPALAFFVDRASHGLSLEYWTMAAGAGPQAWEYGAQRVRRENGGLSYLNAHLLEHFPAGRNRPGGSENAQVHLVGAGSEPRCGSTSLEHAPETDGQVAAALLTYRQPLEQTAIRRIADFPEWLHPLIRLETRAAGDWYVDTVAVADGFEGRGLARRLMARAEELARAEAAERISLIVFEENTRAVALYRQLGYETVARDPIVKSRAFRHDGDWMLMTKPL